MSDTTVLIQEQLNAALRIVRCRGAETLRNDTILNSFAFFFLILELLKSAKCFSEACELFTSFVDHRNSIRNKARKCLRYMRELLRRTEPVKS